MIVQQQEGKVDMDMGDHRLGPLLEDCDVLRLGFLRRRPLGNFRQKVVKFYRFERLVTFRYLDWRHGRRDVVTNHDH